MALFTAAELQLLRLSDAVDADHKPLGPPRGSCSNPSGDNRRRMLLCALAKHGPLTLRALSFLTAIRKNKIDQYVRRMKERNLPMVAVQVCGKTFVVSITDEGRRWVEGLGAVTVNQRECQLVAFSDVLNAT